MLNKKYKIKFTLTDGTIIETNDLIIPIPTTTEELTNDSGFITKEITDLTNYYNKTTIDQKLTGIGGSNYFPIPTTTRDTEKVIISGDQWPANVQLPLSQKYTAPYWMNLKITFDCDFDSPYINEGKFFVQLIIAGERGKQLRFTIQQPKFSPVPISGNIYFGEILMFVPIPSGTRAISMIPQGGFNGAQSNLQIELTYYPTKEV